MVEHERERMRQGDPWSTASPALKCALVVRFLLELALIWAMQFAIVQLMPGSPWRWPVAILAALGVCAIWFTWLSPKAPVKLPEIIKLIVETTLFLIVGGLLVASDFWGAAAIGWVIWLLNKIAIMVLTPRETNAE